MTANVFTIPAGAPFADTLARGLIARTNAERDPLALAQATVYLPTRRATRTLGESFARVLGGAALLPHLLPLGDLDEDEFDADPAAEDLALPPAIDPVRRRLLLATLVQRWAQAAREVPISFLEAAGMARALARFLDEAETQQAELGKLEELAPATLAEHWAGVRDFLVILREEWPRLLAGEGAVDSAARRNLALGELARRYREAPSSAPVIAAGTTGSIPATAELLRAIAQMPAGAVVLPALDRDLDEESWTNLNSGHPQFGLKTLLERIGVSRAEVSDWYTATAERSGARTALLRETLRPAPTTDAWRALADRGSAIVEQGLEGLSVVVAAHPGEEASAIALMLRQAIEDPDHTAALVTTDRNLARRVAAELVRWNIAIDDSAGMPLARTAPGTFLCLLADAAHAGFPPVPLLALFKHPLAAGGERPSEFRRRARELDRFVLRGPRPDPGLAGTGKAIDRLRHDAQDTALAPLADGLAQWFARVADRLRPFAGAMAAREIPLAELARLHGEAAELLAASDEEAGAARLWQGSAGEAAADLMAALTRAGTGLPPIETASYPGLLRSLAAERAVRPLYGRHPRLAILGPLEARLQHFDVLVLGGLNEGTWPQSASADPWLSRPMREKLGFESPERAIGLAAHDFATLACGPRVLLTRALKVDGTPTVASRWLQRLQQLTKGLGLEARLESPEPYAAYAHLFATPERGVQPETRPEPRPPVALRPRELSVTEIETWIRDPYAIYAKRILRLRALDPLDAEIGPMDRGSIMHAILEQFMKVMGGNLPAEAEAVAEARLIAIADEAFARAAIPKSALALWRPRFARAARWFIADERRRQRDILQSFLEIEGRIEIAGPAGGFVLKCRADRIDALRAGGAAVIDYKTGVPPSDLQVGVFAPQLPLEGAILARGGFEAIGPMAPSQLVYVRFAGGAVAGDYHIVKGDARELVERTQALLTQRIVDFDREETAYVPRVAPFRADAAGDYDHLARVQEWSVSGWDGA